VPASCRRLRHAPKAMATRSSSCPTARPAENCRLRRPRGPREAARLTSVGWPPRGRMLRHPSRQRSGSPA